MPGEAELRLRERLSKLKSTGLLRGARLSGELDKLQRQLEQVEQEEPTDEDIWRSVELVGHQKGRDLKERNRRNFGMAYPEGYRKAMRTMELADRFGFPLITFV